MPTGRCPFCKRDTIYQTLSLYEGLTGRPHKQGLRNGTVSLARCGHPDCQAVVYREFERGNEHIQLDIYPPIEVTADEELPEPVKRSFQEALSTFVDGHWNASAQATGRALTDAIRKLKPGDTKLENWAEKGLKRQIEILVQQKVLPSDIGEWAQEVRAVRVLSEHGDEGKDWWATEQEATEALEFAKWIFRYIFVLPEQIKKRRERLKQGPAS